MHWKEAVSEFKVLAANQIEYSEVDIGDLAAQAKAT
jgi:hypothetical protein